MGSSEPTPHPAQAPPCWECKATAEGAESQSIKGCGLHTCLPVFAQGQAGTSDSQAPPCHAMSRPLRAHVALSATP